MDEDGPAEPLFPELPPLEQRWEVTFTLRRPEWDGVPAAPGVPGVTAMYTADMAQAVAVVTAGSPGEAAAAAGMACSGLAWAAGAQAEVRPWQAVLGVPGWIG